MGIRNQTSVFDFLLLGFSEHPEHQPLLFRFFLGMYLVTLVGNLLIILAITSDQHLPTPWPICPSSTPASLAPLSPSRPSTTPSPTLGASCRCTSSWHWPFWMTSCWLWWHMTGMWPSVFLYTTPRSCVPKASWGWLLYPGSSPTSWPSHSLSWCLSSLSVPPIPSHTSVIISHSSNWPVQTPISFRSWCSLKQPLQVWSLSHVSWSLMPTSSTLSLGSPLLGGNTESSLPVALTCQWSLSSIGHSF